MSVLHYVIRAGQLNLTIQIKLFVNFK